MTTTTTTFVTGFGGVRFGILRDDVTGELPEWASELTWALHPVAGATKVYRQLVNIGPKRVTYRIWLDADDDARALVALRDAATAATLTLVDGATTIEGVYEFIHGKGYIHVAAVLLVDLQPVIRRVDNTSEWLATFEATA